MSGLLRDKLDAAIRIPLRVEERHGITRVTADISMGVPLPKGLITDCATLLLEDAAGKVLPHQCRPLAWWPDRSVKWALLQALVHAPAGSSEAYFLTARAAPPNATGSCIIVSRDANRVRVQNDSICVACDAGAESLFTVQRTGEKNSTYGVELVLTGRSAKLHRTKVSALEVEHEGPLAATIKIDGYFESNTHPVPIEYRARVTVCASTHHVVLDVQLRNPRAAHHVGGLWDLGDPGSFLFDDCTVRVRGVSDEATLRWQATPQEPAQEDRGEWSLYQDSSGGERWNSINHVDANGKLTVSFRGYAVTRSPGVRTVFAGRASPVLCVQGDQGFVAAAPLRFWQQFPKALRRQAQGLEIGLFPRECSAGFELQGGERKRHSMLLEFGSDAASCLLFTAHQPLDVSVDPQWIESTGAVPYFVAPSSRSSIEYERYVGSIVEGQESFFEKRERIDEYGWRNFGDLYADHEAVNHKGPEPFISHYNNQYDFIHGAAVHYLRSGDRRWRELMVDAARHALDIDIYHTKLDRPDFGGGLFWHTDHYVPAETCTHRCYSAANGKSGGYGGGPANEHNYTSGLLHYYYLTGDTEARDAVLELADWVLAMDDGGRTLLSFASTSATGLASKTVDMSYHKPGRGAGNSINALLDAYALSGQRHYLTKAEELIQRCIHPADDIDALKLGEPENRWSYLVFLQVLGKYLATKSELSEHDYGYHYARESLLHYGGWMLAHEVPYRDVLDKVLIPTETWPAHDIRKTHVLHLAAKYCSAERAQQFRARAAFFFERCLNDVLSFKTAYVTRPLVLLCVYGYVHDYFEKVQPREESSRVHGYQFGSPQIFRTQRELLGVAIGAKKALVVREIRRIVREITHLVAQKIGVGARRRA